MARLKIKGKYQNIKAEFEKLTGVTEKLQASLQAEKVISKEYKNELEPLRKIYTIVETEKTLLNEKYSESIKSSLYHKGEVAKSDEEIIKMR